MRCIFTNRTIGMTPFSIGTIGTNGPSVWRIVSVCVYWTCVGWRHEWATKGKQIRCSKPLLNQLLSCSLFSCTSWLFNSNLCVKIVQMVSLPVSFLSLAWTSIVADEFLHSDEGDLNFCVKDKVLHFVTHLFILSSRLLAVALFTVSFKWWVNSVLIFHCTVMAICDTTICSQRGFSCKKKNI